MNFATEMYVRTLAGMSRDEIGARMRQDEFDQGFTMVGRAVWLDPDDWDEHTIITQHSRRIRLVALQAKNPGHGAFTRLIAGILKAGLIPVLVEPNQSLIDWCHRHEFRSKTIGRGKLRHEIWYPRRACY